MSIEEGAKYVAVAYAAILAVIVVYCYLSARHVHGLRRDVEALEREVERRTAPGGEAGTD